MSFRIGLGYDVHKLEEGESLWLGGIQIPHDKGLIAHSDGDVLLHAVCDALLGAAKLRDIGYHFPDSSSDYKNIDSKVLLAETYRLVTEKGYRLVNLDATISAQRPRLKEFIPGMESAIADTLGIDHGIEHLAGYRRQVVLNRFIAWVDIAIAYDISLPFNL